jgi:hypothetical protein
MPYTMTCMRVENRYGTTIIYRWKEPCTHPSHLISCRYPFTHWQCCCGYKWPVEMEKPFSV